MMGRRASLEQESVALCLADKTIEQPVAMKVAAFPSAKKESYPAEAMDTRTHFGDFGRRRFHRADRSKPSRVKKRA